MDTMELIPLGRRAGMPASGEASSGYLVQADGFRAILDAGPGTAVRFSRHLADGEPDLVYISHEHTDHLWDLLPLAKMLLDRRLRRDESGHPTFDDGMPRIPLLIPEGGARRLAQLAAVYPVTTFPILDRSFELVFDIVEYGASEALRVAGTEIAISRLRHAAPDGGIRLTRDDRSLVYSGDTGPTPALPELASGAGMLLCESSLREADSTGHGHLSAGDAGRAAAEAGVAELVLTHLTATDDGTLDHLLAAAAAEFPGPIRFAEIGVALTVPTQRKVPA